MASDLERMRRAFVTRGNIPSLDEPSYAEGFLASIFSGATTEFLGGRPGRDVQRFRAENPISGTLTGIGGFLIPAIGVSAALPALGLPATLARLGTAGAAASRALTGTAAVGPIASRALQFGSVAASEEIVRLTLSATAKGLGYERANPGRVAKEIPLNIAGAALIGGAIGTYREHFRKFAPPQILNEGVFYKRFPNDVDANAPFQIKWRQLAKVRQKILDNPQEYPDAQDLIDSLNTLFYQGRESYKGIILREQPIRGRSAYVKKLENQPRYDHRKLIEYFKPRTKLYSKQTEIREGPLKGLRKNVKKQNPTTDFTVRKFILGRSGFQGKNAAAELEEALARAGLEREGPAYGQFFRHVKNNTFQADQRFRERFLSPLSRVGRNIYYGREADGLYVVAKDISKTAQEGSEWVIFKTDDLSSIVPELTGYTQAATKHFRVRPKNSWLMDPDPEDGLNNSPYSDYLRRQAEIRRNFSKSEHLQDIVTRVRESGFTGPLEKAIGLGRDRRRIWNALSSDDAVFGLPQHERLRALKSVLPARLRYEAGKLVGNIARFGRDYLASSLHRYADYAPAATLAKKISALFDAAEARSILSVAGPHVTREGDTPLKLITGGSSGPYPGSLFNLLDELPDNEFDTFLDFVDRGIRYSKDAVKDKSQAFAKLLKKQTEWDDAFTEEMSLVNAVTGEDDFVANAEQLGFSRLWPGKLRVPVYGPDGHLAGYGGGDSPKEAIAAAKSLASEAEEVLNRKLEAEGAEGLIDKIRYTVKENEILMAGRTGDSTVFQALKQLHSKRIYREAFQDAIRNARKGTPLRFRQRKGMLGYQKKFTKQEYKNKMLGQAREGYRLQAYRLAREAAKEELIELQRVRPDLHDRLVREMDALAGVPGKFTIAINNATDKIVAKVMPGIGRNSATGIVNAINHATYTLTLTAIDVGFPAINALTMAQTVLPEVALVMRAVPQRMQGLYSIGLTGNADELRHFSFLDPLKIVARGFRELANPDPELMTDLVRASRHGATKPLFVETYIGEIREGLKIRDVLKGTVGFGDYISNLNRWLPSKSEEFARIHSFITGRILAKEILGIQNPEKVFQFASKFTERTMFVYSQAQRPTLLTGPFGSFYGLFKNWMFNYLGQFGNQFGEAFARGNFQPLLWSMAGTGALTGLGGIPLFFVADKFAEFATDKSAFELTYEYGGYDPDGIFNGKAIDALYYGLPAFFGLSLQSRGAVPGADVIRDVGSLFDIAALDRFKHINGMLHEASKAFIDRGEHPAHNGLFWDKFARATLPRTMYRGMQVIGTQGLRSLTTGNQLISELTIPEQVSYIFGITPLDVQKFYDVSSEMYEDQQTTRHLITTYGRAADEAIARRDFKGLAYIMRQALYNRVPTDSVLRSAETFGNKREGDLIERQFGRYQALAKRKYGIE